MPLSFLHLTLFVNNNRYSNRAEAETAKIEQLKRGHSNVAAAKKKEKKSGSARWVKKWSENDNCHYYENEATKETVWDAPAGFVDVEERESDRKLTEMDQLARDNNSSSNNNNNNNNNNNGPDQPRSKSDWEKILDNESGKHYYINEKTGADTWDQPDDFWE